jgi:rifampicin phosphotransferase
MVEADASGVTFSSIVAREYGIPAVLGTGVATRRITDGARVLVNGDVGTVTLLEEAANPPATPPEPSSCWRPRPRVVGTSLVGALALGIATWRKRRRPS